MVLAVGEILQDRYRIDAKLVGGGMAAVYRAWDTLLDLPVAVKEMIPQPRLGPKALTQLRRQFKREAQILARLDHPNLVRVTDSFSQHDSEYLVMNFIEGESLGDRIDRVGASPEAQVLNWADQLLSALAYCHGQKVFHRDVKSHNVIIRPDGQAVLVDFGLVKLWDPNDPYTKTVLRGMGTPAFAPPEQFEAEEHTDERSDIYSIGATLYHALTGRLPPTSPLRSAMPEKFVPLRSIVPEVSQQTETVVMRAMELARSKRWQSTDEMAEALKVAELSIVGRHRGPSSIVPPWQGRTVVIPGGRAATKGQRKRVSIWIGALSVLTLLLVAVGLMIGLGGKGDHSTPAVLTATNTAAHLSVSTPVLMPSPTPFVTATPRLTDTPSPMPTPTDTPSPMPTPTVTATPSSTPTHSPTPTATPTPTPTLIVHVLQEGENPWTVAQLYEVSVEALLAANGITDPSALQIGQGLIIPREEKAPRTPTSTATPTPTPTLIIHVLKEGENPWTVAQLYGVSVKALLAINGITDPATLQIGQELIIPPGGEIPTVAFTPTIRPTVALPQLYGEPKLLEPRSNRVFGFDRQRGIHLLWTPTSLAKDHWYEVQLRQAEDEEPTDRYWTQQNWWELGPERYRPGDYYWRVVIVQGREQDVVGALSPPSQMWYFQWVPVVPTSTPATTPTATTRPTGTATPFPTPTATLTPRPTPYASS